MDHLSHFEDLESVVRSYCRDVPNLFVSARGAMIWDSQAREFIDFLAGCGSLNYGHNHPVIKSALMNYLLHDGIGNALDFHTQAKLHFIRKFSDVILIPTALDYRMQFTGPTGANCVEAALKLARKHTERSMVVAFTNAFHGMSMGALAATASSRHRERLEGSLQGIVRLPYEGYSNAGIAELERFADMALDPSGGVEPIAAVIVETVQGEGAALVAEHARNLGVIVERCGPFGEVLKILAPLNIEMNLFREGLNRLRGSIEAVATSAIAHAHAA